jgi:hypothetical protein
VLEGQGWRLHRIWSTDWFRNPQRESSKLIEAIRKTCEAQEVLPIDDEDLGADSAEQSDEDMVVSAEIDEGVGHRPSNVEDYRECAISAPIGRELLTVPAAELARLSQVVVEAEGPIHTEEVARRIREAFGLQKSGRRILAHVKNSLILLARHDVLAKNGEFWSVPGRNVSFVRDRRTAALPLRKATMIAPTEYQLAIHSVVKEAVALTRDELVVQAARLFGFDRTGADLRDAIEQEVAALIKMKAIAFDGEKIRTAN